MARNHVLKMACAAALLIAAIPSATLLSQQKMDSINRDRSRSILRDAYDNLKKHYYDPKFHGLDLDVRFRQYDEKISAAGSVSESFGMIAGFLDGLNDSHTFFNPPSRAYRVDYGYRIQMYGNNCFVTRVRPGTDAETKVHAGDQVLGYNKFDVTRADFWKLSYYFNSLAPRKASTLEIRDPSGQARQLSIDAKVHELKKVLDLTGQNGGADIWDMIRDEEHSDHVVRQRWVDAGDVMIWKMPEFLIEEREVDRIFNDARKHKTLIIDLRGNPGGYIVTLERMLGNLFDHDLKVADRVGRKELKPQIAKTRGSEIFTGQLIVLVDSASDSAAELFPRVIQLEHRGTVLGDQTAGAVMEALPYYGSQGTDTKIFYGFSITEADLMMKDGKSLEHTGVTPDEIILPTAKDLASGSDPVLARALELAGHKVDPVAAGKMFPFEWLPN
jgi:C-terminal processing protease CtpA/Prc